MKNLLNPKWLLVINTLPIVLLFLLFLSDYNIIKTLLTEENISYWKSYGFTLFALASLNLIYTLYSIIKKKDVSIYYGFVSLFLYILFIYLYNTDSSEVIPRDIPRWMLSGNLLIYVGTFLMPTLIHSLFIIVIKLTAPKKEHKAWQNFLISISVPIIFYILFQVIFPLWQVVDYKFAEHLLTIVMIIGVLLFLFFLIRGIYILSIKKGKQWKKYQLFWKIPIAILFPLLGLLINSGNALRGFSGGGYGIFGDFSSPWFYILALINGILICLPNTQNKMLRLALFAGRSITFTFTFYFFVVFLPFLPLSIIAVIAVGTGFLMLAPLVLFVIHLQELNSDFVFLKQYFSKQFLSIAVFIACLTIPFAVTLSYHNDKLVLHETLDYIYSPDYSKDYNIDKTSLKKTLDVVMSNKDRRDDFIFGNQTPYLSRFFNWMVLDNLTLSDAKINSIERIFFNAESFNMRPDNINNTDVKITNIASKSSYNEKENHWTSWIDLEITNANKNVFRSEYITTIDLPNGCWINDYYLYVGDKKEMGILAEKKSAMWVFSQIRGINRDPGLLHYLTGNKISFRVFPFAEAEIRKTGIQFIHKEPVTITIDNHQLQLGEPSTQTAQLSSANEHVAYVSAKEKKNLQKIKRTPYYHFVVDASQEKDSLKESYAKVIELFLKQNPLQGQHKVSFANTYTTTHDLNNFKISLNEQNFEGGFYLERTIKKILFNAYEAKTNTYPIIITVTDDMYSSIIAKDFKDFKITFPESDLFYHLNTVGFIASHDLTNTPKKFINDDTTVKTDHSVLAWPNSTQPRAYLANNSDADVVLKSSSFNITETDVKPNNWNSGLLMQGKWLSQILHPENSENDWNTQVKYSFISKIMTPLTSYIVVENEAQKAILKKKQKEVLSGKKSLDLNEETQRMSEPELIILLILFGLFLILKQRKKLKAIRNKTTN